MEEMVYARMDYPGTVKPESLNLYRKSESIIKIVVKDNKKRIYNKKT